MKNKRILAFISAMMLVTSATGCTKGPFAKKEEPTEPPRVASGREIASTEAPTTLTSTEPGETEAPKEAEKHEIPHKHVKALSDTLEDETTFDSVKLFDKTLTLTAVSEDEEDAGTETEEAAEKKSVASAADIAKEIGLKVGTEETVTFEALAYTAKLTKYTASTEKSEETEEAKKTAKTDEATEAAAETKPAAEEYVLLGTSDNKQFDIVCACEQDGVDSSVSFPGGIKLGMTKSEIAAAEFGKSGTLDFNEDVLFFKNKNGFLYVEFNFVTGKACRILLMLPSAWKYEPITDTDLTWEEKELNLNSFSDYKTNCKNDSLGQFNILGSEYDIKSVYVGEIANSLKLEKDTTPAKANILGYEHIQFTLNEPQKETEAPAEGETPAPAEPTASVIVSQNKDDETTLLGLLTENHCGKLPIVFSGGICLGATRETVEAALGEGADADGSFRPGTHMFYKTNDATMYIVFRNDLVQDIWVIRNNAVPASEETKPKATESEDTNTETSAEGESETTADIPAET